MIAKTLSYCSAALVVGVLVLQAEETAPAPRGPDDAPATFGPSPGEIEGKEWNLPVELDDRFRIGKIHDFLNDAEKTPTGGRPDLEFEFKYFNHGAITNDQKATRQGRYYVVSWANRGEPTDVILRFDYRQTKTRDKVRTIEIPFPSAKGSMRGTFSVAGDAYFMSGDVNSWRVSLVHDGKIVAQETSFIW